MNRRKRIQLNQCRQTLTMTIQKDFIYLVNDRQCLPAGKGIFKSTCVPFEGTNFLWRNLVTILT